MRIQPNSSFEDFKSEIDSHRSLYPTLKESDILKRFEKIRSKAKEMPIEPKPEVNPLKRKRSPSAEIKNPPTSKFEEGEIIKDSSDESDSKRKPRKKSKRNHTSKEKRKKSNHKRSYSSERHRKERKRRR